MFISKLNSLTRRKCISLFNTQGQDHVVCLQYQLLGVCCEDKEENSDQGRAWRMEET